MVMTFPGLGMMKDKWIMQEILFIQFSTIVFWVSVGYTKWRCSVGSRAADCIGLRRRRGGWKANCTFFQGTLR